MVANMLSLNISKSDFTVAHRLQQTKESQGDDKRPIIAKICRRYVKCTTLTAGPKKKAEKLLRRWESNSGSKDYFAHPTSNEKGSFKYRQGNYYLWRKGFRFNQPGEPCICQHSGPKAFYLKPWFSEKVMRRVCKSTNGNFSQNWWLNIWIIAQIICLNQVSSI